MLFCYLPWTYKMGATSPSAGANLADVMAGVVPVGIQNAGASLPLVRERQGARPSPSPRSSARPRADLPTLVESGFPASRRIHGLPF